MRYHLPSGTLQLSMLITWRSTGAYGWTDRRFGEKLDAKSIIISFVERNVTQQWKGPRVRSSDYTTNSTAAAYRISFNAIERPSHFVVGDIIVVGFASDGKNIKQYLTQHKMR